MNFLKNIASRSFHIRIAHEPHARNNLEVNKFGNERTIQVYITRTAYCYLIQSYKKGK